MRIRLTTIAMLEVEQATSYLDRARKGTGKRFTTRFQRALEEIAADPHRYPRSEDGILDLEVREYYIERFHYRVVYMMLDDIPTVVAVAHTARLPGFWHDRI